MMDTSFPTSLLLLVEAFCQDFPAQHFAYFRGYIWALARLGPTRKCMTNVARTWALVERHWARWERVLAAAQWDRRGVSQTLVTPLLQQLGDRLSLWDALLVAVDTTLIPNVRGKMPGVQKWPDPSGDPARGESRVGHHWALIGVGSTGGAGYLGWPMVARLFPGQLNPLGVAAGPDGIQRLDDWLVVVALGRELRQYGGAQPRRVVADADFSQASFLNPLGAEGLGGISRLRKDAVGGDHPAPVVGQRPRGRPRQKGRVWTLAALLPAEPRPEPTVLLYGKEERGQVVWRDVWVRDGTHQVRVGVVATTREPIRLVSPDLPLPPAATILWYAARFPLELSLRDGKQSRGLGDSQGQRLLAIHRFVHLALTAYCLGRLTMLRDQQRPWLAAATATAAGALSPRSGQRRHRALRRLVVPRIFAASAPGADSQKPAVNDERIFRIAA
jgi:hypothetical protein